MIWKRHKRRYETNRWYQEEKKTMKYEYEIPHHYTRNTYQPISPIGRGT